MPSSFGSKLQNGPALPRPCWSLHWFGAMNEKAGTLAGREVGEQAVRAVEADRVVEAVARVGAFLDALEVDERVVLDRVEATMSLCVSGGFSDRQ